MPPAFHPLIAKYQQKSIDEIDPTDVWEDIAAILGGGVMGSPEIVDWLHRLATVAQAYIGPQPKILSGSLAAGKVTMTLSASAGDRFKLIGYDWTNGHSATSVTVKTYLIYGAGSVQLLQRGSQVAGTRYWYETLAQDGPEPPNLYVDDTFGWRVEFSETSDAQPHLCNVAYETIKGGSDSVLIATYA